MRAGGWVEGLDDRPVFVVAESGVWTMDRRGYYQMRITDGSSPAFG